MAPAVVTVMRFAPDGVAAKPSLMPLQARGVTLRRGGRELLAGLSFCLDGQGVTAILGPNGAGKTLLLRVLHGLLAPDAGQVSWNGIPPRAARADQGMVFQQPVMLRRSLRANLDFALRTRGVPRRLRGPRLAEALEVTGLTALAGIPARRLSGGERQRLAIARAWVARPAVLFLDEPTASLDPSGARSVEALIARIAAEGTRVILTSHDLGQAARLGREVLFISHGRLLEQSCAACFFASAGPRSRQARDFLNGELVDISDHDFKEVARCDCG